MKTWIRHVSGLVDDLGGTSEAAAQQQFQNHDWNAELEGYDPEKDGPDHCLPAFGIVDGETASCDITPIDAQRCKVNLYFHKPGRLFGLFPIRKNVWEHLPSFDMQAVDQIITRFYARDIEGLSKLIQAEKQAAGGSGIRGEQKTS